MLQFDLHEEKEFRIDHHVETILASVEGGDVTVACWEPGQISPCHCHPNAVEIYFCFEGGGLMRTPGGDAAVTPGSFVLHPRGELHEYVNGPQRTLLFRVRYGDDVSTRHWNNRGVVGWVQREEDAAYFAEHPVPDTFARDPDFES
jgi:quercetin dioxygenase-like cupin family protein